MYETRLSVAERATAAIEPVKRKLAQRRLGVLEAGGLLNIKLTAIKASVRRVEIHLDLFFN